MTIHDIHHFYAGAILLTVAAGFAFGIPGFIWMIVAKLLRGQRARRWPKAEGAIVRSEVDVTDLCAGIPDSEPEITKYPIVEYAYQVRGRKYQSRKFYVSGGMPDLEADEMVARYPKAARVAVFYNPADPADCALDLGSSKGFVKRSILFIIGAVFIEILAIFGLVYVGFDMLEH